MQEMFQNGDDSIFARCSNPQRKMFLKNRAHSLSFGEATCKSCIVFIKHNFSMRS